MLKKLGYFATIIITVASLVVTAVPASALGGHTQYPIPTPQAGALDIDVGPDGAMWFTAYYDGLIGRVTTSGEVTEYPIPQLATDPIYITAGPDNAMWFTHYNKIGRIDMSGVVTEFNLPPNSYTYGIATGSDGALWYTDPNLKKIGRITTAGVVTHYSVPGNAEPLVITNGPDGALWFTSQQNNNIYRLTTSGTFTTFPIPASPYGAMGITSGPDGALWYTLNAEDRIGRITTAGAVTEYPIPTEGGYATTITSGPDGALWFGERSVGKIGRITTAGVITEYSLDQPQYYGVWGITTGPDNALWFTETEANNIGRLEVDTDTTSPTVTPNPDSQPNSNNWYNHDVTVNWTATDPESTPTTPSPVTVTTEGYNQVVTSEPSCDPSGNCASGSTTLNIDKTLPALGLSAWQANPKPTTSSTTLTVPATDPAPAVGAGSLSPSGIAQAEYFIGDTDPGAGNGTAMSLTNQQTDASGAVTSADLTTTFGTNLAPDVYKVTIRVMDKAGNWSLVSSDYLVVFNPQGPTNVTASKQFVPANTDYLPGMPDDKNNKALLGFDVTYTSTGAIDPSSQLSLDYETGKSCNSPHPENCHTTNFTVNTTLPNAINWLSITGSNNEFATFVGRGTLTIDGAVTNNPFRVLLTDANRAGSGNDQVTLYIFAPGANPNNTPPGAALYHVQVTASGNWARIQ
jgi:virginiamycin B lyase